MILINTVSDKYFTLDGVQFARIYQPLAQGSQGIGIYNIYDTKQQLQNSTKFDEFLINGVSYLSQELTIVAILDVIWSNVSEVDIEQIEARVDNLEENQVTGVVVYSTFADLPVTGTLLISYKVSNDPTSSLNGYYHWSGAVYIKDADLNDDTIINTEDLDYLADIQRGYEINASAASASVASFNLISSELFSSGVISQIKINANLAGVVKFAAFRKLSSSPLNYEIIRKFEKTLSSGVNILKVNEPIDEDFYFGLLSGSTTILTEAGDVGAPYDLHFFDGFFDASSVWTESTGRTTNIEIKVSKGLIGDSAKETYYLDGFKRIESSFPLNVSYTEPTSDALNLTTLEEFNAGRVVSIKLNAVADGVCKFGFLRKLTDSPTYKLLKSFEVKVVAGENDIKIDYLIDEDFSFCLLVGSASIKTANAPVGDDATLVFSAAGFLDSTVWNTQQGRGNNIEIEVERGNIEDIEITSTGKTICICGDSITDFCDSPSSNGIQYIGYDKHIDRLIKFNEILNEGYSGIRLGQVNGFADLKVAGLPIADVYTAMFGTNDFAIATQTTIGTISDFFNNTGIGTFYGSLRIFIDGCYAKNQSASIVLFTPSHRDFDGLNSWDDVNANGDTLNDFSNAVREVGNYTGLPVVDLFKDCLINYQTFTESTYDNLHPTTKGYQYIAEAFVSKLKNYFI